MNHQTVLRSPNSSAACVLVAQAELLSGAAYRLCEVSTPQQGHSEPQAGSPEGSAGEPRLCAAANHHGSRLRPGGSMLFKRFRKRQHLGSIAWHLQQMASIERARSEWEAEGQAAMVLAANYELTSHASRALAALRKTEELADEVSKEDAEELRRYFSSALKLPGIARKDVDQTPRAEVERTYQRYRAMVGPAPSPRQTISPQPPAPEPRRSDPPPTPEAVVEAGLDAWVAASGREFPSKTRLARAAQEIETRWQQLSRTAERGEEIPEDPTAELLTRYRREVDSPDRDGAHLKGWLAAMRVVQRRFLQRDSFEGEPYDAMLARAKRDPTTVDFTRLRLARTETDDFDPHETHSTLLQAGREAIEQKDYGRAVAYLKPVLANDYLNPTAHQLMGMALKRAGPELGTSQDAALHRAFQRRLTNSILQHRSGESLDQAIDVVSLAEEYFALEFLGIQVDRPPELIDQEGHHYDVFTGTYWINGDRKTIYFRTDRIRNAPLKPGTARRGTMEYGRVLLARAQQAQARGDHGAARRDLEQFIALVESFRGSDLPDSAADRFIAMARSMLRELPGQSQAKEGLCTRESIMAEFGVGEDLVARKYASYQLALSALGAKANWNDEIDAFAQGRGILNEQEIEVAQTDFHQAVLNRIKVSLAQGGAS